MKKILKKLKGFTLIELLAVIVILAVIALIAIPIVLGIIEDSRKSAAVTSGDGYIRAVNYKIAQEEVKGNITPDGEYIIGENELEVDAKNSENITGEYIIGESNVTWAGLCINHYSVGYYNGKAFLDTASNYCNEENFVFTEPSGELVSAICESSNGNEIYTNNSEFKIKTLEDLACLSETTNNGKNFSGKTIYLVSDLDLSSSSSYKNYNTKKYGDINGDTEIKNLKDELTQGAGFKPIGNFSGTFLGYGFTISNLMINRPNEDNVGLFKINSGTIKGIRLRSVNVTGKSNVGGLVGNNNYIIKNVDVRGTITGTGNGIGGVVGVTDYNYSQEQTFDMVFSGNVKGVNSVGGLAGSCGSGSFKGIVYDSKIEATASGTVNIGATIGNEFRFSYGVTASSNTTLVYDGTRSGSSKNGTEYTSLRLHNVDNVIDTYIADDNDNDKYYFDYDENNKIVVYSTERKPIQNKLKGSGTEESPYIIKNTKDWRMASATVTQGKYYVLMNNINFNNDYLYMLGTETNKFNGNLDGNNYTLNGATIYGYNNMGIVGYNSGTIKNIKLNNIKVTGTDSNIGSLVGRNDGNILGTIARDVNITGVNNVGGLVGANYYRILNTDVRGNVTGTGTSVGGVVGVTDYNYSQEQTLDMAFSGNVKGVNSVGGLAGSCGSGNFKGIVYDSRIEATASGTVNLGATIGDEFRFNYGVTASSNTTLVYDGSRSGSSKNGILYTSLRLHDVDNTIDTVIGGDNNEDGYYFDYDNDKKIILTNSPIANNLTGEGTEENPYIINNMNDWRFAVATVTQSKYYKLNSDIDFENDYYYSLGSSTNKFNGNLDGNYHTLSNAVVTGYDNVGLVPYNLGTIKNIKLNNITSTGTNNNIGSLVGRNDGMINGVTARNINVTGVNNVGGLVGTNYYRILNVDVRGNVTGTGTAVGGITGATDYNYSQERTLEMAFSGNVKGLNTVGGLVGTCGSGNIKGIVYDSRIEATSNDSTTYLGATIGNEYRYNYSVTASSNSTLVYNGSRANSSKDGIVYSPLRLHNVDNVIDTYIAGDNDDDKYYFDYDSNNKIVLYSTKEAPIINNLSGSGTESDPYIINNTSDWKKACATITQGKHYKLNSDISFNNDYLYMFGTETNKFNGNLNGNGHTISNANVKGYSNTGLFGYNSGTIRNIKLNNITVTGTNNNIGSLVGRNDGTVNGVTARNLNVTGINNVGGLVGTNYYRIFNVDVKGTVNGENTVGGVLGTTDYNYSQERTFDMVFSGNVTGINTVGGLAGSCGSGNIKGVVYNSRIEATSNDSTTYLGATIGNEYRYNYSVTASSNSTLVYNGTRANSSKDGTIVEPLTIQGVSNIIDTTGSDGDGFYFGLNNGELVLITN